MKTLACKHCGMAIAIEIITDGELAICDACDTLHNLSAEPIGLPQKTKGKRSYSVSNKFRVTHLPDAVRIEVLPLWFAKLACGTLLTTLFWIGIVLGAVNITSHNFPLVLLSPFFLLGLVMVYLTIASSTNPPVIDIGETTVDIWHRLGFAHNNKSIKREAIKQVYCKRRAVGKTFGDKTIYIYDVNCDTKVDGTVTIIRGLDNYKDALFIEQQIEELYGIEDLLAASDYAWHKDKDYGSHLKPYSEEPNQLKYKKS